MVQTNNRHFYRGKILKIENQVAHVLSVEFGTKLETLISNLKHLLPQFHFPQLVSNFFHYQLKSSLWYVFFKILSTILKGVKKITGKITKLGLFQSTTLGELFGLF